MRPRRLWLILLGILVLVASIVIVVRPDPEPSYGGRSLSEWVARLAADQPSAVKGAEEAIQHIGTNALPYFQFRSERKDGFDLSFGTWSGRGNTAAEQAERNQHCEPGSDSDRESPRQAVKIRHLLHISSRVRQRQFHKDCSAILDSTAVRLI